MERTSKHDGKPARLVNPQKDMDVIVPPTGIATAFIAMTATKEREWDHY